MFYKENESKVPKNCQSEAISLYSRIFIYKYPSIVNAWIIGLVLVLFCPVAEVIPSICLDDQLIKIN